MQQKEIHIAIDETLSQLINVVSTIEQENFNIVPFKDSWTPGEVTQHVVLSISSFVDLLKGPTQQTTRNPEAHVDTIKSIFLNFDVKFKSPDFVVPEKKEYEKTDLLRILKKLKAELEDIIETRELNETCTSFPLPGGIGYLTRQEALAFVVYHTQRHIHQLEKMTYKVLHV